MRDAVGDNSVRLAAFGRVLVSSLDVTFTETDMYEKQSPPTVTSRVTSYHPTCLAPSHLLEVIERAENQTMAGVCACHFESPSKF